MTYATAAYVTWVTDLGHFDISDDAPEVSMYELYIFKLVDVIFVNQFLHPVDLDLWCVLIHILTGPADVEIIFVKYRQIIWMP